MEAPVAVLSAQFHVNHTEFLAHLYNAIYQGRPPVPLPYALNHGADDDQPMAIPVGGPDDAATGEPTLPPLEMFDPDAAENQPLSLSTFAAAGGGASPPPLPELQTTPVETLEGPAGLTPAELRVAEAGLVELRIPEFGENSMATARRLEAQFPPNSLRVSPGGIIIVANDPFLYDDILGRLLPWLQRSRRIHVYGTVREAADVMGLERALASPILGQNSSFDMSRPKRTKRPAAWDMS